MSESTSALEERRVFWEAYFTSTKTIVVRTRPVHRLHSCPVCGYPTITARADFQICELCDWEDDGVDDPDVSEARSGPNEDYTLLEARANFDLYRTHYRPGTKGHETTDWERHVKEAIVQVFEAIRSLPEADGWRHRHLWLQVDELERLI